VLSPSFLFFPSLPFPSSIFPCFSFFVFIFCSFSSPSFSLFFRSIPLLSLFFFLFLLSISFALFYVFHLKFLFLFFLSIVVLPPFFFLSYVSPFGIYKGKRGGGESRPTLSSYGTGGARATLPLSNHGDKVKWMGRPLCSHLRAARKA